MKSVSTHSHSVNSTTGSGESHSDSHPQTALSTMTLPIMEAFHTIQGEGAWTGHAAYFIRTGGCDVGCVWCDVKESWDAESHPRLAVQHIVEEALKYPSRIAVITGGEPLMHPLDALTGLLQEKGFRTHIETSGTHPLSGKWDWITFSPKKFAKPNAETAQAANELKVVIFHKSDFEFALEHAATVSENCKLLLQPEWSKREQMMPLIVDFVKANPRWSVSLQTHKYLQIP